MSRYQEILNGKTKPLGSLGRLEDLAVLIATVLKSEQPKISRPAMLVFAADHGLAEEGISAYPQSTTRHMVMNMARGGAAINSLCESLGIHLQVIDAGVKSSDSYFKNTSILSKKISADGTANALFQAAISKDQFQQCLKISYDLVDLEIKQGTNLFAFGEMGIGNSSSASLLIATILDIPLDRVVGRGTGLDDNQLAHKNRILSKVLDRIKPYEDPIEAIRHVSGFEILMMAGSMACAYRRNCIVVVDGFIATAALCIARVLEPSLDLSRVVFSHISAEHGHQLVLETLKVRPLLELGLRLGEGSGAALAVPLCISAANLMSDMASLSELDH